jgi:hypothetical protein
MRRKQPRTGEPRKSRQPLSIDRLPEKTLQRIQELRAAGHTWAEIEQMSGAFVEWDKLHGDIVKLFPRKQLPHSNLQRWYDVRVEQVRAETMARAEKAREFAAAFTSRGMKDLPEAIRNLVADLMFSLTEKQDEGTQARVSKMAMDLGWLLQQMRSNDIKEKKVAIETKKVDLAERELELKKKAVEKVTDEAARKLGKGKSITVDDINRIRERTFGLPPIERGSGAKAGA